MTRPRFASGYCAAELHEIAAAGRLLAIAPSAKG
jgi:hypothetical protein